MDKYCKTIASNWRTDLRKHHPVKMKQQAAVRGSEQFLLDVIVTLGSPKLSWSPMLIQKSNTLH